MKDTKKLLKRNSNEMIRYDHYIAFDYSQTTTAIARMTPHAAVPKVIEIETDLKGLKLYLKNLEGTKILTIEETTSSHHLYVELKDYVDRIIICDPFRNRLLVDGPKTDKIDAIKLCKLLRAGLLKEVFHSLDNTYQIRKVVSAYDDVIRAGVRVKCLKSAMYRSAGLLYKKDELPKNEIINLITASIDESIELYETHRENFQQYFKKIIRKEPRLKNLEAIPGIGEIGAVTILSCVVDARRYKNAGHYLAYCGLIKHKKMSGGRSYGKRDPRYSRKLKTVYKTAAMAAIKGGKNVFSEYFIYLTGKGLEEHNARNAVARIIAKVSLSVMKNGTKFDPKLLWRNQEKQK